MEQKKAASVLPQFWVLCEISVIITQSSHSPFWFELYIILVKPQRLKFTAPPAEAIASRKTVFRVRCLKEASRNGSQGGLLSASSTMPKSHCGKTGVTLGLCNSIETIISEMVSCRTTLALPVRLSTEPRQVL